jgi:hypothetical protein
VPCFAAKVELLEGTDPSALSDKHRERRACMLERLTRRETAKPSTEDAFLAGVLEVYQEYWLRALRAEQTPAAAETWLLAGLNAVVSSSGGKPATSMDALETALAAMIRARGGYSLHGKTLPLREFMLWRTQTTNTYEVTLPEGVQPVRVVFMDDFLSLGWAAFATCGGSYSGGWTKPDALYAVRPAYDVGSETFRVSYLVHEAQHFADNARFPGLEQPELEYRAKLAELSMAQATARDLLQKFAGNTSASRAIPHSHANLRVVTELGAALDWRTAEVERINAAARELLKRDSQARQQR